MGSLKLNLAAVMVASFGASFAYAADIGSLPLDPDPAPINQPVELGTGWYLRGDAAFAKDSMPKISADLNLLPNTATRNAWDVGFGGGYKFNNWFRADVTYDYFAGRKTNGTGGAIQCPDKYVILTLVNQTCSVYGATRTHRWATLANGYLDLGSWSGISPYVGAGIGFSHMDAAGNVNYFNPNGSAYSRTLTNPTTLTTTTYKYDQTVRSKSYQIAWALMAGVTVDVAEHTSIDFGYRYVNLGNSKGVLASTGTTLSKTMTEQQIRVGLRYMID